MLSLIKALTNFRSLYRCTSLLETPEKWYTLHTHTHDTNTYTHPLQTFSWPENQGKKKELIQG